MASYYGAVGKNAAIANHAIVGHVAIRHEVIVAADAGGPGVGGAAMDGHAFAEDVVGADFQTSRLPLVLQMLRSLAQDGAGEHVVVPAHRQRPAKVDIRANDATATDAYDSFQNR